jgi:hypothetical protein
MASGRVSWLSILAGGLESELESLHASNWCLVRVVQIV